MATNPMPKAKTEGLIVREIDGETLVYDRSRDAARVWRECDGETSVAAIPCASIISTSTARSSSATRSPAPRTKRS
jgi:hypothetical protein